MKKKTGFPILYPNAAGIDIASREHYVAVNPQSCQNPIRAFGGYTEDLYVIRDWLINCKVDTVAMEATGIYWVNLFLILEGAGLKVFLVNARTVKNVSGKKSDVKDAEWIRQLHSCGLLSASFQPDEFTRKLRSYMRHRKNLTEMSATHILMMQKAMEQMNIKLHNVIADITGKSGQAIINAIINGERDRQKLVDLLDVRIKKSKTEVAKSLHGFWKEEHLFELQQSFDLFKIYRQKIIECDQQIYNHVSKNNKAPEPTMINPEKSRSNKNNLHFDATEILKQIIGTDITEIFGITASNAIEIISETGTDMNKWPTAKCFTSWLNLAPNNKISGGKLLSSRRPKKKNKAGQVFKMAAYAIQRSNNWLAHFYHRIKRKSGPGKAITATARKIAVIFYKLIKEKQTFQPISPEVYLETLKERQTRKIILQAQKLGLVLQPA